MMERAPATQCAITTPGSQLCHHPCEKAHTVRTVPGYVSRTWEIVWEPEKRKGWGGRSPAQGKGGWSTGLVHHHRGSHDQGGGKGSEGGKTEVVKGGWVFMAHPPLPSRAPSLATVISFLFWYFA